MRSNQPLPYLLALWAVITPSLTLAADQIIRPFQSARVSMMGGVRMTTGLYEDNLYGNPARLLHNPEPRFQLLDLINLEANQSSITNLSKVTGGSGSTLTKLANTSGSNNHARLQMIPFAYYNPSAWGGNWGYSFALYISAQTDASLRNNFNVDPSTISDANFSFTLGRRFLRNRLAVGVMTHAGVRLSSKEGFSFIDIVKGAGFGLSNAGGGVGIDVDAGATYDLPMKPLSMNWQVGLAMNNILGGRFDLTSIRIGSTSNATSPRAQSFALGAGVSASRKRLWIFRDVIFALEATDIGKLNSGGSLFRTLHIGAEGHYGIISPRLGINQGYLGGGLGFDLSFATLDLGTYGEEMSLNAGGLEDRRFVCHLGFKI